MICAIWRGVCSLGFIFDSASIRIIIAFDHLSFTIHAPCVVLQLHGHTIATLHYARGIAHAVLGDTIAAVRDLSLLRKAMTLVGGDHVLHNNLCSDMLAIAEHMLQGELYYRLGGWFVWCM